MKRFLSLDIETTGLDESYCQVLEFGAVIGDFDSDLASLPSFSMRFRYSVLRGEAYALSLNHQLISDMARGIGEFHSPGSLWSLFCNWLVSQDFGIEGRRSKITVTGKNIGSFDRRFLTLMPNWEWEAFSHRYLDPGSLYFDPVGDEILPDTKLCAARAGIDLGKYKLHTATDDARLVVDLIRRYYKR